MRKEMIVLAPPSRAAATNQVRLSTNDAARPRRARPVGGRIWAVDSVGLPGPEIELLVQVQGHVLGRFVLTPTPGLPGVVRTRVVAVALADQVGASLRPRWALSVESCSLRPQLAEPACL